MQSLPSALGNSRYDLLRQWLNNPSVRVQRVIEVTAAWWWPDGAPATARDARRALKRAAAPGCRHPAPLKSF